MAKPDYFAHDARYRQLRAEGAAGWDPDEVSAERERELEWAVDAMGQPVGKRMLELGCGAGNHAAWFIERGFEYTGVDISPTAIDWAKERGLAGARFVVGDLTRGLEGEYDLIVDGHCLHCIIGDDRGRLLLDAWSALKTGGHLFVATMCGVVTSLKLKACFEPVTRCQVVDGVPRRFIGEAAEILDELRVAGFEVQASVIDPRDEVNDQDHVWAIARKARAPLDSA